MRSLRRFAVAAALVVLVTPLIAQVGAPPAAPLPILVQPAPSPATRLEGFQPEAGSVVTLGYEELGGIGRGGILVDVRQVRDSKGNTASGVTMHLTESSTRNERAFVDADELPGLLNGLDALLKVTANPTQFKKFEVRFATRGNLAFVAYNNSAGRIEYSLQVGRLLPATILSVDAVDMFKIRGMFELALQKLSAAAPSSGGPGRRAP